MNDSPPIFETGHPEREIVSTRLFPFQVARVFEAWKDPRLLARGWGPKGFTNSFELFEFAPGGSWRFIMHSPQGRDFPNESVFREIIEPELIVLDHILPPYFQLKARFNSQSDGTRLVFTQLFATEQECSAVKRIALPANEENFDRLQQVLAGN